MVQGLQYQFHTSFLGIFVTGGFNFYVRTKSSSLGQFLLSTDDDAKCSLQRFSQSKMGAFVIAISVSMILAVRLCDSSVGSFILPFCSRLYNLGVNSYLRFIGGSLQ